VPKPYYFFFEREVDMKKQAIWLTSFLLIFIFSSNYANARIPNMLEIKSASVDLESGKIYIQGLKFGNNPIVALDKVFLEIDTSNDTYIQAWLPRDRVIEPRTFRLIVARDFAGFYYFYKYFTYNKKTDLLDITIGADEKSQLRVMGSPMPLSPPGELGSVKFYKKYKAVSLQPTQIETITCSCDVSNDINDSTFEYLITVMESYPTYNNRIPRGWTVRVANYAKTDTVTVTVRILCVDMD
jgi:hypothetical protein